MEVQILCTKLIKPSVPTPPYLRTLKQSPVDQIQNSFKTTLLLYYSADGSTGKLKGAYQSVGDVTVGDLDPFLPLAGRYMEDVNWVDCKDEGVEFFCDESEGLPAQ